MSPVRRPPAAPAAYAFRVNASDRTPADLLRSALAADPARPLVTFYDDATGERVELSVATFANWVAKTANLLQGELSAAPGDRLALLLPAHWQTRGLAARLLLGRRDAEIGGDPADADLVVSGPDTLDAGRACGGERVALSLRPLGGRFPQPPAGFADYAVEVPEPGRPVRAVRTGGSGRARARRRTATELTGAHSSSSGPARTRRSSASPPAPGCCRARPYDTWKGLRPGCTRRWRPAARWSSAGPRPAVARGAREAVESERVTDTAV